MHSGSRRCGNTKWRGGTFFFFFLSAGSAAASLLFPPPPPPFRSRRCPARSLCRTGGGGSLRPRPDPSAASKLDPALEKFMARFPGESGARQPVHTVYGGAHLFKSDTTQKLGVLALRALDEYGPNAETFGSAIGADPRFWEVVFARVLEKLRREPVEDFRIDFEDGYGNRADAEEDAHAGAAAKEVATGMKNGTLPPFIAIRIKQFSQELMPRSMRKLDIFVSTLLDIAGKLPPNFVVTLPKIQLPQQVTALADLFDDMEPKLGLARHTLRFEFMIETTQAILSANGDSNLPLFLDAARGRAVAAHFGTYDYTASCNITAEHQRMDHPACDFARHMMQVAYAGTGLWLSDGATNIMPIAPHRGALSENQ